MHSTKSGLNFWKIWQVFGPWASPYGANGQMTITVQNYRPRQFHKTSNGENPSSGYRDMGSASLAAARPDARPTTHLPARTVTTIPLQPEGLRGKKHHLSRTMDLKLKWRKYHITLIYQFLFLQLTSITEDQDLVVNNLSLIWLVIVHYTTTQGWF